MKKLNTQSTSNGNTEKLVEKAFQEQENSASATTADVLPETTPVEEKTHTDEKQTKNPVSEPKTSEEDESNIDIVVNLVNNRSTDEKINKKKSTIGPGGQPKQAPSDKTSYKTSMYRIVVTRYKCNGCLPYSDSARIMFTPDNVIEGFTSFVGETIRNLRKIAGERSWDLNKIFADYSDDLCCDINCCNTHDTGNRKRDIKQIMTITAYPINTTQDLSHILYRDFFIIKSDNVYQVVNAIDGTVSTKNNIDEAMAFIDCVRLCDCIEKVIPMIAYVGRYRLKKSEKKIFQQIQDIDVYSVCPMDY